MYERDARGCDCVFSKDRESGMGSDNKYSIVFSGNYLDYYVVLWYNTIDQ